MLDDVYNKKILDFASALPKMGRLENAHGTSTQHSKLCGAVVTADVRIENGLVADYAQDLQACALGQAAASILAHNVDGATIDEVMRAQKALRSMLKENGPVPEGRFSDLKYLEPVKAYKARHASVLLAFDAVVGAIQNALENT
jgi:NifU-like protein involved in Fe-S cluster formation